MVALERINVRENVGRKNNCKLNFFSMYFVRNNEEIMDTSFNNNLAKITHWARRWKMSFNPGPSKQALEAIFSRKVNKDSQVTSQRHLGIIPDNRLSS